MSIIHLNMIKTMQGTLEAQQLQHQGVNQEHNQ